MANREQRRNKEKKKPKAGKNQKPSPAPFSGKVQGFGQMSPSPAGKK